MGIWILTCFCVICIILLAVDWIEYSKLEKKYDKLKGEYNEEVNRTYECRMAINKLEGQHTELKSLYDELKYCIDECDLKPAVSVACSDCQFSYKSRYSGKLLGCTKGNVCSDFYPRDVR